jgi:hypothetical protein
MDDPSNPDQGIQLKNKAKEAKIIQMEREKSLREELEAAKIQKEKEENALAALVSSERSEKVGPSPVLSNESKIYKPNDVVHYADNTTEKLTSEVYVGVGNYRSGKKVVGVKVSEGGGRRSARVIKKKLKKTRKTRKIRKIRKIRKNARK